MQFVHEVKQPGLTNSRGDWKPSEGHQNKGTERET